jgi:uncharacterized protein (TIGR00369 family)
MENRRMTATPHSSAATSRDAAVAAPADAAGLPPGFRAIPRMGDFIAVNGPLCLRHEGDLVRLGFRVDQRHTNPLGICHGGMMATFCDMLLPMTIHRKSREVGLRFLPTINLQVDYLAPAPLGAWVEGEGQVLRTTRTLVFAQGLVTADGTPCARVSGIFKIGPPFDPTVEAAG